MFWTASALAADIRVPDDAATLAQALAEASDGDTITLMESGRYTVPRVDVAVELIGAPSVDVVLVGPIVATQDLGLRSVTVAVPDALRGIDAPSLSVHDVRIVGEGTQTSVVRVADRLTGADLSLSGLSAEADVLEAVTVTMVGLTARDVTAGRLVSGVDVTLATADIRCGAFDQVIVATDAVGLDGLLIAGTTFDTGVDAPSKGSVWNATFLGKNDTGTAIALGAGSGLALNDSVVMNLRDGVRGVGAKVVPARLVMWAVTNAGSDTEDASFAAAVASNTTNTDPFLTVATGCDDGDWPMFGSPLVDVDGGRSDHDASDGDLGATGGPNGLDVVPDADGDLVSASRD
jgi:hypothetical protein